MSRRAAIFSLVVGLVLLLIPICRRINLDYAPPEIETQERPGLPISPYDDVMRAAADSLGMDWRLIAAVAYHESRFHNDASSPKGAVGLMQVLSSRYSQEYLLDPKSNLIVGARYLKRLQAMYSENAASPTESLKFALAAYNYGEGKVWRLIRQTKDAGEDSSRWDVVARRLPKGHHTVSYVEKVLDTYSDYHKRY